MNEYCLGEASSLGVCLPAFTNKFHEINVRKISFNCSCYWQSQSSTCAACYNRRHSADVNQGEPWDMWHTPCHWPWPGTCPPKQSGRRHPWRRRWRQRWTHSDLSLSISHQLICRSLGISSVGCQIPRSSVNTSSFSHSWFDTRMYSFVTIVIWSGLN